MSHHRRRINDYSRALREFASEQKYLSARQRADRQANTFKWIGITLGAFLLVETYALPEHYKVISDQWALSWTLGLLVLAALLTLSGLKYESGRLGLKRWTFWVAAVASLLTTLIASQFVASHFRTILFGVLAVIGFGVVTFAYVSKRLHVLDSDQSDDDPD